VPDTVTTSKVAYEKGKRELKKSAKAVQTGEKSKPSSELEKTPSAIRKPMPDTLENTFKHGDDINFETAKVMSGPFVTNAVALSKFGKGSFGDLDLTSLVGVLAENSTQIKANDMTNVEATLNSQAMALNIIFGELTRRTASRLSGETINVEAVNLFFKMAMKAQNQCRMTLETLANIKNPPVVYAKQANIANGPQQVNNGNTSHAHATENRTQPSKLLEQDNEQRMDAGTKGQTSESNSEMATVASVNRA
jgi:hypothetical protein